ncbi:MAG TPA: CoA transferase, partial [Rhodospirillaceae bacterium]|nr:CoA transferase [Rhodospirillaceae bacterium]
MAGPLDGYRILDLTSVIMGPFATQNLGDMGADVIKVESPSGDLTRAIGPARNPGMGAMYLNSNRNKRSLVLDLKQTEGRDALLKLAEGADVLVHSMRPQAMRRLGLEYTDLKKSNPNIIYCACYGFGEDGPYAGRPAYDDVIQGVSGLSSILGFITHEPRHVPALFADKTSGMAVTQAVAFALLHRERTGEGQEIDVPMFETMVHFNLVEHFYGAIFEPAESEFGYTRLKAPDRRPMPTKDGHISLMPYTDDHWRRFFTAVGREDMLDDRRVTDATYRAQHIAELYAIAADIVKDRPSNELLELLVEADVPCTPVNRLSNLMEDPHLQAVEFIRETEHPSEGKIKNTGIPTQFSKSPGSLRRHAPTLGEH